MTVYVAMLRGINIGPRNRLSMPDLRSLVESLGFEHVETYVQSGNVVFRGNGRASDAAATEVASTVAEGIRATYDLDVPVVARTRTQLDAVMGANPFVAEGLDPGAQPTLFHVTFLADVPTSEQLEVAVDAAGRYAPDACRVAGQNVYLHIPGGYGETKLNNAFFEKKLSTAATTRNWRSVTALAAMAAGLEG